MSKRIIVDPVTRIEGHLRIEVEVDDNNVVTDAFASSTLFRGIETIVKNRDPRNAGFFVQRICGVCTYTHYEAGICAVENALGIIPPYNAVLVRSLMKMSIMIHDHIVHFYQLHALDWVDVLSALKADPKKASQVAYEFTDTPLATGEDHLQAVQEKVAVFVKKGHLGPFANGYWGNVTYRFTPEENLIALSHYLECLKVQRVAAQMLAIYGAKQPHPQSLTVGGVTCIRDLQNPSRMGEFMFKFKQVQEFVDKAYYADLVMAARAYADEPSVLNDLGVKNLFTYTDMPINATESLLQSGIILNGDISKVYEVDDMLITEDATHSWYGYKGALQPYDGETDPDYTGFIDMDTLDGEGKMVNTKAINKDGKYSWIKAPRYNGLPMQVGPLSDIIVNYAKGDKRIVKIVDEFLEKSALPIEKVFSTLGRTACRMLEAKLICDYGLIAFNSLVENLKVDNTTCTIYEIDNSKEYKGRYIGIAPRGVLSHWVRIKDGLIFNYQAVVPTTWNGSPMDEKGQKGPFEQSLLGLKISNLTQPLEIIRTIHSFDPCLACSVHVMDTKGNELSSYKVNPSITSC